MQVRQADESDVAQIAEVWHRGWHQGHASFVPQALVKARVLGEFVGRARAHLGETHVAYIDGALAGFYMVNGDELYQFYVDAAFQGTGTASGLIRAAERTLAGHVAWLACSVGNDRAARFYEKSGWQRRGEVTYTVETTGPADEVTVWRYEKDLT